MFTIDCPHNNSFALSVVSIDKRGPIKTKTFILFMTCTCIATALYMLLGINKEAVHDRCHSFQITDYIYLKNIACHLAGLTGESYSMTP